MKRNYQSLQLSPDDRSGSPATLPMLGNSWSTKNIDKKGNKTKTKLYNFFFLLTQHKSTTRLPQSKK